MCDLQELRKKHKRSFSEAWLNDDRFKSWIRKVPIDDTLFHCTMCRKNFSCSSSHVLRHADSACHKNNINESTSLLLSDDDNVSPNKKIPRKRFKGAWLEIDSFKPWLREVADNVHSVFCTFCNASIAAGLSQIYRHAESKKHIMMSKQNENYTIISEQNDTEDKSNENKINKDDVNESLSAFKKQTKLAEIRYAALIADKNISHQTAEEILFLFQEIGKDYNVLKNMSMGRTKCTNIISNVLCPVEMEYMVNSLQGTKFSILIDEPFKISKKTWMTFLARYVDPKTLDIRSQLVRLINIDAGDNNAETLFNAFKAEMCKLNIPFVNIVAFSCNNVYVMTSKYLSFKTKLEEMCENILTLACPCYSAALAAHAACDNIPDYCEEFLQKVTNFIISGPKSSALHQDFCECFQESNHKILNLSSTRWISHYSCVERLVESWDDVKLFLIENAVNKETKSGTHLLSTIQILDVKAYFLFLKYVLNFFHSFNTFFQTVETRIHLLQPKSIEFLTTICKHFLKSELLNDMCNIKFTEKENQKSIEEVYLGIECEEYLDELLTDEHTDVVANIRENCLQFYITAAEEINKRLPIKDKFLSNLKVFQSHTALLDINRETSFAVVSSIAKTFGDFDESGLKKEWLTLHLDFAIPEKNKLLKLNFDDMWKHILQKKNQCTNDKYPNLKRLLNAVRSLPNSNADPERKRMFSVLTDLKAKKRKKLSPASINAICVFKSALKSRKETALDMDIDEKHLSLMSSEKLYNYNPNKNKKVIFPFVDVNNIAGPSSSDV